MVKNIKKMVMLMMAAVAMLAVSCNREEPEPQKMDIVGTSWKQYIVRL